MMTLMETIINIHGKHMLRITKILIINNEGNERDYCVLWKRMYPGFRIAYMHKVWYIFLMSITPYAPE